MYPDEDDKYKPKPTDNDPVPPPVPPTPPPVADTPIVPAPAEEEELVAGPPEIPPTPAEVEDPRPPQAPENRIDLSELRAAARDLRTEVGKLVVGQREFLELLLAGFFAGGHVLIEGVPGIAKTLTARLLAKTVDVDFNRIQFTPDLMPSDVTGSTIFNVKKSEFTFNPGPIFSNIVLIDEINRAPAKTQAALFEVMEEGQVTVDGTTHPMGFPFFVVATQNPIEQEGTYKLPEAQLDRFLARIIIDYPELEEEQEILRRFRSDFNHRQEDSISKVMTAEQVRKYRGQIEEVFIKDELLDYIAAIVHRTRNHPDLFLGASPRASLAILRMSKAVAALDGRDYVTPDDIQYVAYPVLNHRVILTPEREMEGYFSEDVINGIVQGIEVPR
ncbi:MAG: MoxR family ATPase [Bacteroidota bacterium]